MNIYTHRGKRDDILKPLEQLHYIGAGTLCSVSISLEGAIKALMANDPPRSAAEVR